MRAPQWQNGGQFRIALAGGNTPRPVYSELAGNRRTFRGSRSILLLAMSAACRPMTGKAIFAWPANRCSFPAGVPEKSIARIRGEIEPQIAAQEYQDELDRLAAQSRRNDLPPRFDSSRHGR